jgi:lipid II:glycine glycyltransferase (peptidoglycan interpeptide bridge formation enzyme)
LIIKISARRGTFLHCPHGPIVKDVENKKQILQEFFIYLKNLARKEKCHFLRISPLMKDSAENKAVFQDFRFKNAPIHMHPELAWILDISPSEEALLKGMRKTTRYLIKKAQKDGVEIIRSSDTKDLEKFWKIYEDTSRRQHFTPFSRKYLQLEWETFAKANQAVLFFGKYRGEFIAAALIIFSPHSGFYHQGASLQKYAKIPASYLLQWEAIREAKKRGCRLYNFWGVCPENEKNHPWAGLSLFKKGFGGFLESYVQSQDLILSPFYYFNFLIEIFRKIKRGF